MGGTITLFSKKVYSESAKTWTRYMYYVHMAKITKQTSQVSHKTNECQNETALTRWLSKIIYIFSSYF